MTDRGWFRVKKKEWRLTNQKNFLDRVTLIKSIYNMDVHNHCAFCWDEFRKGDIGYTTQDEYHWVCDNCFKDFKEEFYWKVIVK